MWSLQKQIGWVNKAQWTLAAAVALVLGAFWFFGYRPQTAQLADLRRSISNEQRELAAGKTQTSILPCRGSRSCRRSSRTSGSLPTRHRCASSI
jgi:hypothetical protein